MNSRMLLEEMTFPEKIGLIEDLWDYLSRAKQGFTPPEWHGEVLKIRKERIESGDIGFTDWEVAKKEIREWVAGKFLRDLIEWGLTSKSRYISYGLKKDIQNANNRSRVPTDR